MVSISAVLTAPRGISHCDYLGDVAADAKGCLSEIIIVDSGPISANRSHADLFHIQMPGARFQALIAQGFARATGDWIWLSEDHARPLPGLFSKYSEATQAHPEIDLFSGATENITSTSPWAFANFFLGLIDSWPNARKRTPSASNANLFIRRSAIRPSELAVEGGIIGLTTPRLIAAGRHAYCAGAAVDHVADLGFAEAFAHAYSCAERNAVSRRESLPARPLAVQFGRDLLAFPYYGFLAPLRTLFRIRGTRHFHPMTFVRLVTLGLPVAAAVLMTDVMRIARRAPRLTRREATP